MPAFSVVFLAGWLLTFLPAMVRGPWTRSPISLVTFVSIPLVLVVIIVLNALTARKDVQFLASWVADRLQAPRWR